MLRACRLLPFLCFAGCALGSGTGSVAGDIYLAQCVNNDPYLAPVNTMSLGSPNAPAAFDLHPTFFVADTIYDLPRALPDNRLSIRVQTQGNFIEEADALLVNIASERLVLPSVGQPIAVGPDTNIRAALSLAQLCPEASVQIELDGTMTFTKFGPGGPSSPPSFYIQYGDELHATFELDAVDRRAIALGGAGAVSPTATVSGHLSGFFDFVVNQGRAAQAYP